MLFVLTIIGLMLLLDLLWWWRADRALRKLPQHAGPWRAALAFFVGTQVVILAWIVLSRILDIGGGDESVPTILMIATFIWHFLALPVATGAWLLRDSIAAVGRIFRRPPTIGEGASALSRREFMGAVAMAATPPIVTGIATGFAIPQLEQFRTRAMTIGLPTLPPALDGMTIAHVADVHVGRFTSGPILNRIADATNSLRADLVLMTGDLINHAIADLPAALDMVKKLDARHGVYMCEGNHDLIESREEFERITKASGVPLLINETRQLDIRGERVQLLGLRWGSADPDAPRSAQRGDGAIASSMKRLLALRDPAAFPILLAHHPHAFDPAVDAGIPLTLSGHTHGGQLMFSPSVGFGPWMFRYWSGLYQRATSALVVSNGVGNWFPIRTHAPAEIIHITLRRTQ